MQLKNFTVGQIVQYEGYPFKIIEIYHSNVYNRTMYKLWNMRLTTEYIDLFDTQFVTEYNDGKV